MRVVIGTAALFGLSFGLLDVAFPVIAHQAGTTAGAGCCCARSRSASAPRVWSTGRRSDATVVARLTPLTLLAAAGLVPLVALPPLAVLVVLALAASACSRRSR